MTETEAKTKWCPQAGLQKMLHLQMLTTAIFKSESKTTLESFRGVAEDDSQKCIASDCMMWKPNSVINEIASITGHCGLINK